MSIRSWLSVLIAGVFLLAAGAAGLVMANQHLTSDHTRVGGVPVEVVRPDGVVVRRPAVVVVHGYAGSGRLMRPFADTLARRGYVVLLPDLAGHGANTRRLDVPSVIDPEIASVVDYARGLDDVDPDRVALLGHSMGAGAVVRAGAADPRIVATVAISLPGDQDGGRPQRLLLLVGALEPGGIRAATERAAGPGSASGPGSGDGRRLVVVPLVEHISVLFAPRTHREAADWLDTATGNTAAWNGIAPLRRVLAGTALLLGAMLLLTAAAGGTGRGRRTPPGDALPGARPESDDAGRPGGLDVNAGPRGDTDSRGLDVNAGPRGDTDSRGLDVNAGPRGNADPRGIDDPGGGGTSDPSGSRVAVAVGRGRAAAVDRVPVWVVAVLAGAPGVVGGALLSRMMPAPVTGYLIGYFALTGLTLTIAAPILAAMTSAGGNISPRPLTLRSLPAAARAVAARATTPPATTPQATAARAKTARTEAPPTAAARSRLRPWAAAPISTLAGGVAVVVPVQMGLTLMVPHGARWWLIAALALATATLLHGARALAGPGWEAAVLVLVSLPLPVAAVIGLAPGFLMLIAPLVAILFVLYVGLAALGRHSAWWHPVAAGAVMIAWPIAVALPVSVT